ncbi:MAG: EAL domain-containing protein [Acidobacteria bacterium]|nr:EAL domain-containing protein [Acidobacteriota bacterium]
MENTLYKRFARYYIWAVIILGMAAGLFTIFNFDLRLLSLRLALLFVLTLSFGSRIVVRIPRVKGQISVSDTFILLTMLLFDGEAAILMAGADALCSSIRVSMKKTTTLFNTGVFILSTFVTVWVLRYFFGSILNLTQEGYTSSYIIAVCLMGFVQYIFNSGLVAVGVALKAGQPLWQMWRQNFLWTSLTYFAGASAASIIAKLVGLFGIYAIFATGPIIAVVYFTYCTYLRNVEASNSQAELAQRHAEQVQTHMEALRSSEEKFRSAFDYATIGMAIVSPEGRWLQVNRSLCEIIGYSEPELLASNFQKIAHAEDLANVQENLGHLIEGKINSFQAEQRYVHQSGREVWVHVGASVVHNTEGHTPHLIFQIQDITDRKRAEEQLLHDAFHDALTGLPNRALFMDHAKMAIHRSRRDETRIFAALFLDLDRFKVINDSLGHMVGDQLLVGIARRLETCLRPGDTVARLGGDEFTILLEDLLETEDAVEIAVRVQEIVSQPFNIGGHEVCTTASIGIAASTIGYVHADDLLRDADTAMYRAKLLGKNRHVMFDKAMHERAMKLLQIEIDLRRAVERQEFFLQYQPIISLAAGEISGFEALIRWQHPERGLIPPVEFISVAEETGLIIPIGHWVLREACQQMQEWRRQLPSERVLTMSVNLSGKQFSQPDLTEQIAAILSETGLSPSCLKLEITESMVMENIDTAIGMLTQLRALGVELAIDDFGTGYSSLSYLHRFPINTLKIDRSFVSRMLDNTENEEIVRTIVTLARSIEMNVVAEGVETASQLEQLRTLECDFGQGYLFSKPLAAADAFQLLSHPDMYQLIASRLEAQRTLAA